MLYDDALYVDDNGSRRFPKCYPGNNHEHLLILIFNYIDVVPYDLI